jgi:hypothetical protein
MANYYGISLFCDKLYIAMLHRCMQPVMEAILGESQMGFRSACVTTNAT